MPNEMQNAVQNGFHIETNNWQATYSNSKYYIFVVLYNSWHLYNSDNSMQ